MCRPWLLPAVYERVRDGKSEFLAELRPAAALFLGFSGIDVDVDYEAETKLNTFVRWVHAVVTRYGGSLLQVMIGDKGNYLYTTFGVPVAHEDDAVRAVAAAMELRSPSPHDVSVVGIRIGVAYGQMRAGAYGGPEQRTYGVQGTRTNLAAHLMQHAEEEILCDEAIFLAARRTLSFEPMPPIPTKGGSGAISVFRPVPSLIQNAVNSHLDQLPSAIQVTLRVASVIGVSFSLRLVQDIHPIGEDSPLIQSHLEAAEAFGIVTKTLDGPDPTYSFTDSVTRDQLYRLLLFAQRRRLLRAVAEWYKRAYGDDLAPHYSTLASHWYASEDRHKAGRYYELAANHASDQGFPHEAERFFRASIALAAEPNSWSMDTLLD